KKLARRTEFVEARPGEEVPPEDGFSWRKYGKKLVQNIPEYYRCARHYCGATKMVQRTETESLTFEVTYGGSHNCDQAENNNQNEQLVFVVQTHVRRTTGELSEFYIHETPNNSHNNLFSNSNSVFNMNNSVFVPTPTSSTHPVDNNSRTDLLFVHDVPENTRSTYESSANDLDS
uniref:WRKY domain-containing protein n=1 Tax=Solanum lycopersicum TaxID=4081 RepID=A0A3Q7GI67_SOLLC